VHRLLPEVSLLRMALPAAAAVTAAAVPVLAVRFALWGGHRPLGQVALELVLWGAGLVLWTWVLERPLLRELRSYLRARREAGAAIATDGLPVG
jgi:hypothetical protein